MKNNDFNVFYPLEITLKKFLFRIFFFVGLYAYRNVRKVYFYVRDSIWNSEWNEEFFMKNLIQFFILENIVSIKLN